MTETTPLLRDFENLNASRHDNDGEHESNAELRLGGKKPPSAYYKRIIKVFNITVIVLSALTIATLIANIILTNNAHSYYGVWYIRDASIKLIIVSSATIFFSFVNVIVNFPILLDVTVDAVLVAFVIPRVSRLIDSIPNSSWCGPGIFYNRCERSKLHITILMGTAAWLGGIVAIIYLVLLLLRGTAIIKTKDWKRLGSFPWTISAAQISFEVNVKVLKQETTPAANVAQAGPSGSQ